MSHHSVDDLIRRTIGGDERAISCILEQASTGQDALLVSMAALLAGDDVMLRRAAGLAASSRDRQIVAIARAHLARDSELVDALARDHLVEHPTSLIVSWIASGAAGQPAGLRGATLDPSLGGDTSPMSGETPDH